MRWTLGGHVGHGMAMENSSMAYRTRHGKAARAFRRPNHPTHQPLRWSDSV